MLWSCFSINFRTMIRTNDFLRSAIWCLCCRSNPRWFLNLISLISLSRLQSWIGLVATGAVRRRPKVVWNWLIVFSVNYRLSNSIFYRSTNHLILFRIYDELALYNAPRCQALLHYHITHLAFLSWSSNTSVSWFFLFWSSSRVTDPFR